MQEKILEWVVKYLLQGLNAEIAAKALVGILRAGVGVAHDVAAKTATQIDDSVVAKLSEVVEDLAKALKV